MLNLAQSVHCTFRGRGVFFPPGIELQEVKGKKRTEVRWYALGVPLVSEEVKGSMSTFVEGMFVDCIRLLEEKLGAV